MPLTILVPMILVGLPLVIGLVWYMGGSENWQSLDTEKAVDRFKRDFPGFEISDVILAENRESAILLTEPGKAPGLVLRVGKNCLTRVLDHDTMRGYQETDSGLKLEFHDFTLRQTMFPVACAETRETLISTLDGRY